MERRKFIGVAGIFGITASGLAISGLLPVLSCSRKDRGLEAELKNQALLAFKRFEEVWDFNDFWKRGNTFDACLRFADAVQERWPDDPAVLQMNLKIVEMLEQNLVFFQSINFGDMWADDFGWWGLLGLNARKFLLQEGEQELADAYWDLSRSCWEQKKIAAYDHSISAVPVAHGCRNGDANGNSLGVKNTVTNVLLFLLSSRIYRMAKAEGREEKDRYLAMAYAQWKWFSEWFALEEYEYLKKLSTEGALVQERPMAFFEGSTYIEKEHPPWAEGWVWTGDQGMIVAALCDMIAVKDDLSQYVIENETESGFDADTFAEEANKIIQLIGKGVENAFVGDADELIHEAACYSSLGPVHGRDYVAGRGIMMRYLGSAEEKSRLGVNLDAAVLKTTQAIWESRDEENNQFQAEYTSEENDSLYIEQFREEWGMADELQTWNLDMMHEKNKNGVCQAVGMDIIGAAIRVLK